MILEAVVKGSCGTLLLLRNEGLDGSVKLCHVDGIASPQNIQ